MSDSAAPAIAETVLCRGETFRIYLDADTIARRVAEIGRAISEEYDGQRPILIGVLNGAYMFLADLMRQVTIDCEVDFLKLSSLRRGEGVERDRDGVEKDRRADRGPPRHRRRGHRGHRALDAVHHRPDAEAKPASVKTATLLHKKAATNPDLNLTLDYVGFEIDNLFVIGYGLDFGQLARNLPAIYILDEQAT